MSEQPQDLRERLEQLRAEIQRTQPVDDAQRQHLADLQAEVHALLANSAELSAADHQSAGERIRANLAHFETTHTVLSSLIEQVLNTLSGAGI